MGDSSRSPEAGRHRGWLIPHLLAAQREPAVPCLGKHIRKPRNLHTCSFESGKKKKIQAQIRLFFSFSEAISSFPTFSAFRCFLSAAVPAPPSLPSAVTALTLVSALQLATTVPNALRADVRLAVAPAACWQPASPGSWNRRSTGVLLLQRPTTPCSSWRGLEAPKGAQEPTPAPQHQRRSRVGGQA